jgi:hypothetical protein
MGRDKHQKERQKDRLPPFVPVFIETLDSSAWRAMSHGAKMLYIALKRHYSRENHNNGRIFLSQRDAEKQLRSHHDEIARWFRELQHFGFIVMQTPGFLGVEGMGQAPRWRLTELGHMRDLPTKDFLRWDGTPFVNKTKPRSGKAARGVQENPHKGTVRENHTHDDQTVQEIPHKSEPIQRAGKPAQN